MGNQQGNAYKRDRCQRADERSLDEWN